MFVGLWRCEVGVWLLVVDGARVLLVVFDEDD